MTIEKQENSFLRCDWEYHRKKDEKTYLRCVHCGRVKRSDLPDVQQCVGSSTAHKTMLRKILGQEVTEKDMEELEKDDDKAEDEENNVNK